MAKKPVNVLHDKIKEFLQSKDYKYHEVQYGAKVERCIAYQVNFIQYLVTPAGIGNGRDYIDLKDGNYDECIEWLAAKIRHKETLIIGDEVSVIDRNEGNYKAQGKIVDHSDHEIIVQLKHVKVSYRPDQLFKLN